MVFLPVLILALHGCGEMDTMLSSGAAYRVGASTAGNSLDNCAISIRGEGIQPYFISSVSRDPDIMGLLVYLETPEGVMVGEKVRYTRDSTEIPEDAALADPAGDAPGEDTEPWDNTPVYPGAAQGRPVYVPRFEGELPLIPFPEGLTIGHYILVMEVLGVRETLHRVEKPFFFLDNAELSLGEIFYYRSEWDSSSILPTGAAVMLEARVYADPQLKPWLVWYNGKQKISEGPAEGGSTRIFWKTPDQAGFQTIRAELFPAPPLADRASGAGYIKEISLPVSARHGRSGGAPAGADAPTGGGGAEAPALLARYLLAGNLAADTDTQGKILADIKPLGGPDGQSGLSPEAASWLPWGRIYGLGLGPGRAWTLPAQLFSPPAAPGTLRFSFMFAPLAEGIVFSGSFRIRDNAAARELVAELSWRRDSLVLDWSAGEETGREMLAASWWPREAMITAAIDIVLGKDAFTVSLYVPPALTGPVEPAEDDGKRTPPARIAGTLTGSGAFYLGRSVSETGAVITVPGGGNAGGEGADVDGKSGPLYAAEFDAGQNGPAFVLDEISLVFLPGVTAAAPGTDDDPAAGEGQTGEPEAEDAAGEETAPALSAPG
jgi:hypothetical protein